MGIYNYTFRAKKRKAILNGEKVDLHLMPYAYRGDGIGSTWHMSRAEENRANALLERRHDLADRALKNSTSKLAIENDDFKDIDTYTVWKIKNAVYCDASSRPIGECVGFVKMVGKKITIVDSVDWHTEGSTVRPLEGGPDREVWYRYSIKDGERIIEEDYREKSQESILT